ncbi:ATP-binding protein [Planctomycetota bacterium]
MARLNVVNCVDTQGCLENLYELRDFSQKEQRKLMRNTNVTIFTILILTVVLSSFCLQMTRNGLEESDFTSPGQHFGIAGLSKLSGFTQFNWLLHKLSELSKRYAQSQNTVIGLLIIIFTYLAYRFFFNPFARPKKTKPLEEAVNLDNSIKFEPGELEKYIGEKVQQRTKELKSANENLRREIAQRPVEESDLQHRLKQLNCLYGLSRLVEQPEITLAEVFHQAAYLLRDAYWQPDFTCVGINFDGIQYNTDNFEKSEISQYAQIKVNSNTAGAVEVYYLGQNSKNNENAFIEKEQDLLDAVAGRLGSFAERKHAAERLQLLRKLIDRSSDCIFVIDPKWGRFLDVNNEACKTLGYTREELLSLTVKDIEEIIPDDSAWQEHVRELKLKQDIIKEGRHKRKDGTTFFVETSLNYVTNDKQDHIIAMARDITERKKAEQKQTQLIEKLRDTTQELEDINQELKDFAYIISHDLKAPLRGIKTLADWLSADYADKLDEEGKEQMGLLLSRVARMHNLIEGVLHYSKASRSQEEKDRVDLNEIVSNVIDMIAPPEHIDVTVDTKLPTIFCEPTRIMQVFQNLVSNAVKYMDKPRGWVKIGCLEEDDFWKFTVADNGPGIEQRHFERIFKMFQTLTPKDEFESTGVGLTVVKKIVKLYGGEIWLESTIGQGSTFFFTLTKQKKDMVNAEITENIAC